MKPVNILNRKRIHGLLSTVYDYPLTILESPMGFGKTTAIKTFTETDPIQSVWITFKKYGDSVTTFWDKFIDEIFKVQTQSAQAIKSLGFPTTASQLANFFSLMRDIKFNTPILFILDDYHLVSENALHNLILLLAEEELEGLHILVSTRDTTDIDFVELFSKDLCNLITQKQLRFNKDEIRDYCQLMAGNVSEIDLLKIREYTEGWVSFMYILLRGLVNDIPIGMNTTIEELIEKVFFDRYDATIQDFLLRLSLMEDFTVKQAEYVTEYTHTNSLLKKLHKENAFVYYDEKTGRYKIHNVLLDFLRLRQNLTNDVLNRLYCQLGKWYYKNNELLDAYRYLYKAGETKQLLLYLNNPINIRDHLTAFEGAEELFSQTPQELLLNYPFAYLQHIFLSIVKCDIDNLPFWEDKLKKLEQYYQDKTEIDKSFRNRILSEILIVRKFTLFNHIEEMKQSNEEILNLMDGQNSYIALQENSFTFGSPHYLYLYYRDVGSFQKIASILSKEVGYAKFSNGCGSGCDSLSLAEYALETGDFESVELHCEQARVKALNQAQTSVMLCSRFTLLRYRLLEGKIPEALDLLTSLEQDIARQNDALLNTSLDLCKGYLFTCLGQLEKIPLWLQTGDMSVANLVYEGVAFNYLVYGKAVLLSKRYAELEVLTTQFDAYFSQFSNQLGFIHNNIFKAVAKFHLYESNAGVLALEAVLQEAFQDQIVMPFIEAAPYITEMLQTISQQNPDNEFINRILRDCRIYNNNISKLKHNSIPLSQREIEIITLIDEGLSRKQIAERLYISQETAKSHLKNIYQKLEVGDKVSALRVAKARGFLS